MSIELHPRKIKGFAFVTFVMPQNAVEAFAKLDGTSFQVGIWNTAEIAQLSDHSVNTETSYIFFRNKWAPSYF